MQSLVFTSTNLRQLSQLNALASMRRIDNLTVNAEGNPITKLSVWRPYVVFRLAHFSLKHINGSEVVFTPGIFLGGGNSPQTYNPPQTAAKLCALFFSAGTVNYKCITETFL